jgi:hypothetical protein
VIAAAVLAFGFVYVHPFEDGNGRIHRYLIHHVLAQRGFNPAGVVFPVSAAILERIDGYRTVLEDYSQRLLPVIDWEPTEDGNLRVLNDTGDFYQFFDATPHAEFLYSCVRKTVENIIIIIVVVVVAIVSTTLVITMQRAGRDLMSALDQALLGRSLVPSLGSLLSAGTRRVPSCRVRRRHVPADRMRQHGRVAERGRQRASGDRAREPLEQADP